MKIVAETHVRKRLMIRNRLMFFTLAMFFAFHLSLPALYSSVTGEDTGDRMVRAQLLLVENKEDEALPLFETILQEEPDNYLALLSAAFLHFRQGWLYSDKDGEKYHYVMMQDYAQRALDLNPMAYQAKLISLVAKAKTADYHSPGYQVRMARELQEELEALMASGKNDPDIIYFLSWLNYKVGKVGSMEKLLASILFGGLPENLTIENAIELMQKAIDLRPDYSIYHYDLGLFRLRMGQLEKARSLFEKVLCMEPRKSEELVYRQWAERRLNELASDKMVSN